jgi:hypothetical protein
MRSSLENLRNAFKATCSAIFPTGECISKSAAIDMFAHNWYLAFTSFGGPTVHFQIFQQLFVEKYGWIDMTTYQEMFALCQSLSGPGSTKMIYAINVLRYGFWTGLLSFFLWSLPMSIAAFGLSLGVENIGDQLPGPVYALLSGLNSATGEHVRQRTEIRSSPPMMETEMEQDDLPEAEHQAGAVSPQSGPTQILRRDRSLPRLTGELRSLTESFAGATQLISSSDPTPMSVDNDSAST